MRLPLHSFLPLVSLLGGVLLRADFIADYPYSFSEIDPLRSSLAGDLTAFRTADASSFPEPGGIVCIGSSSMRVWHGRMDDDLAPLTLIHRGFGGSVMTDVIYFADEFVIPYRPRAILLYEGDNDIVAPVNRSPERIRDDVLFFVEECRAQLPDVRIYLLAIKPSIARASALEGMQATNALLEAECAQRDYLFYIDVMTPMLDSDGVIRRGLFIGDNLHMNDSGYDIWRDATIPILVANETPYEDGYGIHWGGRLAADDLGNVETDWLGWVQVSPEHHWVYSWSLQNWIYFPDPGPSAPGGWAYLPRWGISE